MSLYCGKDVKAVLGDYDFPSQLNDVIVANAVLINYEQCSKVENFILQKDQNK